MYQRLCKGLADYGKLIPTNDDISKHVDKQNDYYLSVYKYNEEQKQKFDKTGSIAGINDVVTNDIIFDFDSKNLEKARQDSVTTINRLKQYNITPEEVNIYFSGSKGFHLVIHTSEEFTPKETKTFAEKVAKDLETFDSSVYNSNRIFRVVGTKHNETGLYKTPLSFEELESSNITEFKKLATESYNNQPVLIDNTKLIENVRKVEEVKHESTLLTELDLTKKPSNMSCWKYALEQGFFPSGQRSNALIILASTYRNMGYSETKCYYALKAAADLQSQRFGVEKFDKGEIYNNIITQVYADHWNGGTYAEDNFPESIKKYLVDMGVPRQNEEGIHENYVVSIDKGFGAFEKYATDIDKNTMKFGIKELDNVLKVQTEHLIGILGAAGSGKTSMALTLLNNTSKQGIRSFFASYDMGPNIVIQKLIQRQTGQSDEEIFDTYRNKDLEKIEMYRKALNKNFSNVSFCFKSGQSVKELRNSIVQEETRIGEPIKLIIVDYLELIRTSSNDPTNASMEAIQGLREIANEGRVVVCLLQPNKMNSDVSQPVTSYNAAKGSAAIGQAVTSMIGVHRPGFNPNQLGNDHYFSINILKNRMGGMGVMDFSWNGPTGRIKELEDIERQALAEFRAAKEGDKDDDLF